MFVSAMQNSLMNHVHDSKTFGSSKSRYINKPLRTYPLWMFFFVESSRSMFSLFPKDHWTLKTGHFEDPTPASSRFVHPSIGGSLGSLGFNIFKPLVIHQYMSGSHPINSHHSPQRPATSHHRSSDQSPTKRSRPPDLMSWDHGTMEIFSGAILERPRDRER